MGKTTKLASNLLRRPVLLKQERAIVGIAKDLVIDPSTGQFLGVLVQEGFGKKKVKALASKDIVGIGNNFFLVSNYSDLGEVEDIIRIKSVYDREIKIIKNKVFTTSGRYLGKCYDFMLDFNVNQLIKIYVNSKNLLVGVREYLINFDQIISIEKDKIVVEEATVKSTKSVPAASEPAV